MSARQDRTVGTSDPGRPSRFRLVVLILVGAAVAAFALLVVREIQVRRAVYTRILEDKTATSSEKLGAFAGPVRRGLRLIREWDRNGTLEWTDPAALDERFVPMLESNSDSPLAFLGLVSATGDEYVLEREAQGWRGVHASDGSLGLRSTEWYEGARRREGLDEPFWTDLESGAVEPEKGLTAAIAWTGDGPVAAARVAALGVAGRSLRAFLDEMPVTENGLVVFPAEDGSVLWIAGDSMGLIEPAELGRVLRQPDGRTALIYEVLDAWRDAGLARDEPLRLRHGGELWWFLFSGPREGDVIRDAGCVIPRRDLAARLFVVTDPYAYALFGVIGIGVLALIRLAYGYRRRLVALDRRGGHSEDSGVQLRALIDGGESERLEFKSTLRWNLQSNKPGREIELAWLKSLVAFMNSDGGTVLVGVHDDGTILGTESDRFRNDDKYLLHFNNLVHKHIGLEYGRHLSFDLRPVEEKRILVVDCRKSNRPAFLRVEEDEDFYVRIGPASRKLSLRKTLEHLKELESKAR